MIIYNIEEKEPEVNQYCFVNSDGNWIFCIYKGKTNNEHEWIIFLPLALGEIKEWQSAQLTIDNPTVDLQNKKVIFNLTDVVNEEKESMYAEFVSSIFLESKDDNTDRNNSDIEDGREILSPEISVL